MQKILQKIIETDRAAKEKVAVQKERLDMINYEIAAEKKLIDDRLHSEAQKEIQATEEASQQRLTKETEKINNNFEETKKRLLNAYNDNHEKWELEIFKKVIG